MNHIKGSDVPHTSIDKMRKIAIVDCMVLVQQMTKSQEQLVLLKILRQQFNDKLFTLIEDFDEVIFVFDTYKVDSLKQKPREKSRQGKNNTRLLMIQI